ncbi:hypothetical protein FOCC_FOCC017444 [Frankliniella occidentalis]|nr:hypothetical protein FOCC_FOCC017444 [Frankliniella occidentalis]
MDLDDESEGAMPWGQFNEHFKYEKEKDEKNFLARCVRCPVIAKPISCTKTSSSNLKTHLARKHEFTKEQLEALNVKPGGAAKKRKSTDPPTDFFAKRRITQEDVNQVTDQLVINETLPHRIVESPYFKKAVLLGCPTTLTVTGRKTFRKRLDGYYKEMHENVTKAMDSVEYVATTADGWTKHSRSFLGVTAHWINPDTMEREGAALALTRLKGSHTHERLAQAMCKVTQNYNLPTSKITRCSTDSASNFKKAFRVFAANAHTRGGDPDADANANATEEAEEDDLDTDGHPELSDEEPDDDDGCDPVSLDNALSLADLEDVVLPPHQRCGAHIINLIATKDVEAALDINVAYKRVHVSTTAKLKEWWRRQGRSDLVAEIIKSGLGVKLEVPGETRWNSEFDAKKQIVRLIEEKGEETFNAVLEKAGLSKLLASELRYIREYVHVMHPVALALDIIQRDINMYAGYLLPTVLSMESQLQKRRTMEGKSLKSCDVLLRTLISAIRTPSRFEQYLDDQELRLATVLLPQFKLDWEKDPLKREDLKTALIEEARKVVLPPEVTPLSLSP